MSSGASPTFSTLRLPGLTSDDDEVAVAHGDASSNWRSQSDPLVNIRLAVDRAVGDEVITALQGYAVTDAARRTFFAQRRLDTAIRTCVKDGIIQLPVANNLLRWVSHHSWDAKAEDARMLLQACAESSWLVRPRDDSDKPISAFTPFVSTWIEQSRTRRISAHDVNDEQVRYLLQLFAEDAPFETYRRGVATIAATATPMETCGEVRFSDLEATARNYCRQHGLIGLTGLTESCQRRYLDQTEIQELKLSERQLMAAARSAALSRGSYPSQTRTSPSDSAANMVAEIMAFNEKLARGAPNHHPNYIAAKTIDRYFTKWWKEEECLEMQARRRGFPDINSFRSAARHVIPYAVEMGTAAITRLRFDQ